MEHVFCLSHSPIVLLASRGLRTGVSRLLRVFSFGLIRLSHRAYTQPQHIITDQRSFTFQARLRTLTRPTQERLTRAHASFPSGGFQRRSGAMIGKVATGPMRVSVSMKQPPLSSNAAAGGGCPTEKRSPPGFAALVGMFAFFTSLVRARLLLMELLLFRKPLGWILLVPNIRVQK